MTANKHNGEKETEIKRDAGVKRGSLLGLARII